MCIISVKIRKFFTLIITVGEPSPQRTMQRMAQTR